MIFVMKSFHIPGDEYRLQHGGAALILFFEDIFLIEFAARDNIGYWWDAGANVLVVYV